jgi:hypothetical protein
VSQDALVCRATLFILSGPHSHLHVVINDPIDYPPKGGPTVLLVNFCSHTNALQDATCLFEVGDHPFITNSTYVEYSLATLQLALPLGKLVAADVHRVGAPVSEAVYGKIVEGFRVSQRVPRKILNFLDYAGL